MLKFNRNIQKCILSELKKKYPLDLEEDELFDKIFKKEILSSLAPDICEQPKPAWKDCFYANLFYLREHGLISFEKEETNGDEWLENLSITAKGIDFIADDGGLSAILGVVTVKLHADTIKALLSAKIDASDLSPKDKERYKSSLSTIKMLH